MSKLSITVHGDSAADLKTNLGLALASLGAAAPAAAAAKPAAAAPAPKPAAPAPKPAAPKPAAAAPGGPDLNSLREQGRACIKAGKNAEMKAALTELGADSITTMDPAKYGELAAKLTAILSPEAAAPAEGEDAL